MKPFKFAKNRVWRAYKGGALIDEIQGVDTPDDGYFPEEWVASCVKAINRSCPGGDGVSIAETEAGEIPFDELLQSKPEELLGPDHYNKYGANTGFLSKILDSAIRLPLQAHPDNVASESIYGSRFGKTEAWIVLGTREVNGEKPYLIVGFNENLDKDLFVSEAMTGEMPESLKMVHKHDVKAGDVLIIKGGTIHAIGPGMLIYEIMEPTDFVAQPERYCGEQMLTDNDRFGIADPVEAMKNVFHYSPKSSEDAWNDTVILPKVIYLDENVKVTELINRKQYKFFGAKKIDLSGAWLAKFDEETFYSGTVMDGEMEIVTEDSSLKICKGESFFMPYGAPMAVFKGNAEVIITKPPIII